MFVEDILFPKDPDGKRPAAAAYDLVTARRWYSGPALAPYVVDGAMDLAGIFRDRCSTTKAAGSIPARHPEFRRLDAAGILDLSVAEPVWRGGRGGWAITLRQVFVMPPGAEVDIPGARIQRVEAPGRKDVAAAIARLWRYPRGLVVADTGAGKRLPPPSAWVAKYLAARQGRRLFSTRGIFYGASNVGQDRAGGDRVAVG